MPRLEKPSTDNRADKSDALSTPSGDRRGRGRNGPVKSEKRREAILVEAERIAHLGSYEWDVGTDSVYRSDELCRVFGIARDQFKPGFEGYLERVHPEERARTRAIIENSFRQKIPFEFDERIVHPDGTVHELHSQGKWVLDRDQNPLKLFGVCQDVTEKKFAAGLLAAEKHVLECIAKRLPLEDVLEEICREIEILSPRAMASIMLMDPDRKHIRPAAGKSLPERWISAITPMVIGPVAGACGTSAFRGEAVVAEDISQDPLWMAYPDILKIALDCGLLACFSTPIFSGKNEILGTLALYYKQRRKPSPHDRDLIKQVTNLASVAIEHDRTAAALQRANDELEKRVRDRTAELTAANRELEAFVAAVSHDLRSPLKKMHCFAQLVVEDEAGNLSEEGRENAASIVSESGRMHELVEALLKHSQATRAKLRKTTVDLSRLASDIARDLRNQQPGRSVDFVLTPGLVANGDPVLLHLVLQNLLDNAWKFTAKAEHARIEFGVTSGDHPAFFIRDNGAGFDNSRAAEMFVPFQRLHSAEEFPGTGIGLATVHQIISRHGGEIWADGAPNKGATFFFTLP